MKAALRVRAGSFGRFAAAAAVAMLMISGNASAHDFVGFHVMNYDASTEPEIPGLGYPMLRPAASRGVIDTDRLWEKEHALTICFLEGAPALRTRIASTMMREWPIERVTGGNLRYDKSFFDAPLCTDNTKETFDITVAFRSGGYWSAIGPVSATIRPSMNFTGFTRQLPPAATFEGLVGHEMGHALGLDHEHQSPNAPACRWDFDGIAQQLGWQNDVVRKNFERLKDDYKNGIPAYWATPHDPRSIMHYQLGATMFKDGKADPCFIAAANNVPSKSDLQAIHEAYSVYEPVQVAPGIVKQLPTLRRMFPASRS